MERQLVQAQPPTNGILIVHDPLPQTVNKRRPNPYLEY
jgi:hypothetical protein